MQGIGEGATVAGTRAPRASKRRKRIADMRRQTQRRAFFWRCVIGGISCAIALYAIYAIERMVG